MTVQTPSAKNITKNIDKHTFWEQQLSAFHASNLSRKAFCIKHSLAYYQFQYWYRRINAKKSSSTPPPLLPIKITKESMSQNALCTLELRGGHRLVIHETNALRFLLEQLL